MNIGSSLRHLLDSLPVCFILSLSRHFPKGVAKLTMDDVFMRQRELLQRKPVTNRDLILRPFKGKFFLAHLYFMSLIAD
jgi:hypothetical protein